MQFTRTSSDRLPEITALQIKIRKEKQLNKQMNVELKKIKKELQIYEN